QLTGSEILRDHVHWDPRYRGRESTERHSDTVQHEDLLSGEQPHPVCQSGTCYPEHSVKDIITISGLVDAHHDSIFLTNSVGSLVTVCCHNNREDVKLTATFGTMHCRARHYASRLMLQGAGLRRRQVDSGPECDLLRTAADIMRPVNKHLSPPLKSEPTQTGPFHFASPSLLVGAGMLQMVELGRRVGAEWIANQRKKGQAKGGKQSVYSTSGMPGGSIAWRDGARLPRITTTGSLPVFLTACPQATLHTSHPRGQSTATHNDEALSVPPLMRANLD
ncbi:hypothetical protein KUCAC02_003323, partial [Chaenocephalus aceratus]